MHKLVCELKLFQELSVIYMILEVSERTTLLVGGGGMQNPCTNK